MRLIHCAAQSAPIMTGMAQESEMQSAAGICALPTPDVEASLHMCAIQCNFRRVP